MKYLFLCFFGVCLVFFMKHRAVSQSFYEWTDPEPITDSLTDNTNPYILTSRINYSNDLYLVWEKSTDTLSSAIYFDNLLDSLEEQIVISNPGIQYTNPKMLMIDIYNNYSDTIFFLLYETNEPGNIDIHYMVYLADGSFTAPEPFVQNPDDDVQFEIGSESVWAYPGYNINSVVWINNDDLYAKNIYKFNSFGFSDDILIDSGNCSNPVVSVDLGSLDLIALYQKNDSVHSILKSSKSVSYDSWSEPQIYYDSTDSKNPTISLLYYMPCWTTFIDSSWRIVIQESFWDNDFIVANLSSDVPFDPSAIGEWPTMYDNMYLSASMADSNGAEIYLSEYFGSLNMLNFSNSGTINRDPKFFVGEWFTTYCWYNYLTWESFRNGHWQIYYSKAWMCYYGLDENSDNNSKISINPNPFSDKTTITFGIDKINNVRFDLFDIHGTNVLNRYEKLGKGKHEVEINGENLSPGLYIIRIIAGDKIFSEKLIKN